MGAPFFGGSVQVTTTIDQRTGAIRTTTQGYQPEIYLETISPWEVVTIGGIDLYVVRQLRGEKDGKFDELLVPGMSGAQIMYMGDKPAKIHLELEIFTQDQLTAWEAAVPLLRPRHGKSGPLAIDVVHPALSQLGIRRLYPLSIAVLERTQQSQVFRARASFIEQARLIQVGVSAVNGAASSINGPQQQPASPATNPQTVGPQ